MRATSKAVHVKAYACSWERQTDEGSPSWDAFTCQQCSSTVAEFASVAIASQPDLEAVVVWFWLRLIIFPASPAGTVSGFSERWFLAPFEKSCQHPLNVSRNTHRRTLLLPGLRLSPVVSIIIIIIIITLRFCGCNV